MLTEHTVQQRRIKLGGQVNALFTLALTAAQIGNHQPRLFHQAIDFAEQRRPAIGQPVFGAAGLALLRDTVGIGQGQQGAQPTRMIGISHRLGGLAAQVALILPGQLPGTLHPALPAPRRPVFTGQQGQTAVHIGPGAAQNIAFTQ